jgi:hypothetical protein
VKPPPVEPPRSRKEKRTKERKGRKRTKENTQNARQSTQKKIIHTVSDQKELSQKHPDAKDEQKVGVERKLPKTQVEGEETLQIGQRNLSIYLYLASKTVNMRRTESQLSRKIAKQK